MGYHYINKCNNSRRACLLFLYVILVLVPSRCYGWDWYDYVAGGGGYGVGDASSSSTTSTLSLAEVSTMRVRDIKRRLARNHGYSADEISKMLDKKELIQALAFEEHKIRETHRDSAKRELIKQGIIFSIIAVVVVICWPVIYHVYEVAAVNFVVYTDRKKYEAKRCYELRSVYGLIGILAMLIFDLLQVWLSVSILASWIFKRNKYFFPTPSLPLYPAQFMGNAEIRNGPLGGYGINVGPMVVSWALRFIHAKLELWTGKALAASQRKQQQRAREQKKQSRENETAEERKARRAARRAAKKAQAEAKAQAAQQFSSMNDDQNEKNQLNQNETSPKTGFEEDFRNPYESRNEQSGGGGDDHSHMQNYQSQWVDDILRHQANEQAKADDIGPTTLDELD